MNVHPDGTDSKNKLTASTHDFFGEIPVAVSPRHSLSHGPWQSAWPEQSLPKKASERHLEHAFCERTSDEPGQRKRT